MSSVVLVARLVLVGVFALAGVGKLLGLAESRAAVEGFGVPSRVAGPVGTALPFIELVLAIALLPTSSARWAGVAGAMLLAVFCAGIARALRQGLTPDCNCFGQVASEPIGIRTLVRNGLLALIALLVAIDGPGAGLDAWTTSRPVASTVAALSAVVAAVLAVVLFARRGATVPESGSESVPGPRDELPPGTPAPAFELPGLDGTRISLQSLLTRGRPVVLVFASPTCAPCRALIPHLGRWNRAIGNDVTLVIVESTWRDHVISDDERAALSGLVTVTEPERQLAEAYGAPATPCAISLTADGLISSGPMPGSGMVERLIRTVLETAVRRPVDTPATLSARA